MKAKRTISIGLLIIAVLAMTVTPALAGGDNHRRRWQGQRFGLVGEVVEVEGQTITHRAGPERKPAGQGSD